MFQVKDGLFFDKLPDNGVKIIKRESGQEDAPVVFEQVIDANAWASIIATMSYYGEEDYGFYRALNFHRGDPIGETTPLVDKTPENQS